MKIALILLSVISVALMESCNNTGDCTSTSCTTGTNVTCSNHLCTCISNTGTGCTRLSDCNSNGCGGHGEHCIDGHCHCFHDQNGNHQPHNPGNHHPGGK